MAYFNDDPGGYVRCLLADREMSKGQVQIPHNWQDLFAPLLQACNIRASYITKAVGMCSIRALFGLVDDRVWEITVADPQTPVKQRYFSRPERKTTAMNQGTKAHRENELAVQDVRRMYGVEGKQICDDYKGFVDGGWDAVIVQEKKLESVVTIGDLQPFTFSGTPDLVFGRGKGRSIFVAEHKTHVHKYSPEYLRGCVLQGLGYCYLVSDYVRRETGEFPKNVNLLLTEASLHYDEEDFDPLVEDGTTVFLENIKANMKEEEHEGKTRLILPYNEASKVMLLKTLAELRLHQIDPHLFAGVPVVSHCKRFGGCEYIKSECPQYQKLQGQEPQERIIT